MKYSTNYLTAKIIVSCSSNTFARRLLEKDDQVKGQTSSTIVNQHHRYDEQKHKQTRPIRFSRYYRVAALPLNLLSLYDLPIKDDESSEAAAVRHGPQQEGAHQASGNKTKPNKTLKKPDTEVNTRTNWVNLSTESPLSEDLTNKKCFF